MAQKTTGGRRYMVRIREKGPLPFFKYFSLKKIADDLGIKPDKVYNNFNGKYNSIGSDCDQIASLMIPKVEKFFLSLGYQVIIKKNQNRKAA